MVAPFVAQIGISMPSVVQGESITLSVVWRQYEGGPVDTNVTGVTVEIVAASGGSPVVAETSTGVTEPTEGTNAYEWEVDANQAAGDYFVTWRGTDSQDEEVTAVETVTVTTTFSEELWCTVEQAENWTGLTFTTTQLFQAQGMVEVVAGISYSVNDKLRTRDRYHLAKAVAYQAIFMRERPGAFSNHDITTLTQNGVSASFASRAAVFLAPLTIRSLKNLSFWNNRSFHMDGPSRRVRSFVSEEYDDSLNWVPIR